MLPPLLSHSHRQTRFLELAANATPAEAKAPGHAVVGVHLGGEVNQIDQQRRYTAQDVQAAAVLLLPDPPPSRQVSFSVS